MGTERFKSALLSVLVIVSIIAPAILFLTVSSSSVAAEEIPPPYYMVIASVDRVVDGDTIDVWIENIVVDLDPAGEVGEYYAEVYGDNFETVRFGGGIDAPELNENGGPESKEFVGNLIPPETTVYLDLDNLALNGEGRRYRGGGNRLIAVIYVVIEGRWINVNADLLRWGMEAYPGNYWDEYIWIESEHSLYDWPPYDNSYPYVLGFMVPHGPIYIDGNDNFTLANGVVAGSGTLENSYVINNWDINAENANGIEIRNTTAHFIIRNCHVYSGGDNGNDGIRFENVVNGRIDDGRSDNNYRGINFFSSNNNIIVNSTAENNSYGILLEGSENNLIYNNNLVNNTHQAYDNGTNYWDNGYPSGGNYWSDYAGEDNYWGENQNIPGNDGIGDTPYSIPPGANQDRYPIITYVSRGVEVSISSNYQSALPGVTLTYTVTVTNTGDVDDNYALSIGDDAGWGPSVSPESLIVLRGASDNATLSVTVPENAVPDTEDNITITATSQTDNTVSDSDLCIAHVLSPKAEFSLITLYKVSLDVNLYLTQGSKLIVRFYTYEDAFEDKSVFENFSPPAIIEKFKNIFHPENIAVKKARLDLTTDNTENIISTIATFVVRRGNLMVRISVIKSKWPFALPPEKSALISEISGIKSRWPYAPT